MRWKASVWAKPMTLFAPKEPSDYQLRFSSPFGSEVTEMVAAVPASSPFSVFAT
jgi:hypothetical protein